MHPLGIQSRSWNRSQTRLLPLNYSEIEEWAYVHLTNAQIRPRTLECTLTHVNMDHVGPA